MNRRQSRAFCRRYPDREVSRTRVGEVLGLPGRLVPADVLPMTGAQVLATALDPPAWLLTALADYSVRQKDRADRRDASAEPAAVWTREELHAEYTLTGLKEGLAYDDAYIRGKAAADEAARTIGVQGAGELMTAALKARAEAIRDALL
ncbi:hypothetical protein [Streptomyces atratus]